jgi:hypothetical protein
MGNHTIPAGTLFTDSPEVRITCRNEDDGFVLATLERELGETSKRSEKNCFLRPASDEERDGHLARLKGILRMDSFLRKIGDMAKTYHHGEVSWLDDEGRS